MSVIRASILIPAHDEAERLPLCLDALLASRPVDDGVEVIVIANGCTDDTAAVARSYEEAALLRGWDMIVLELNDCGKLGALAAGEAAASGGVLIYLDADVRVSPALVTQLADMLSTAEPRYASGVPVMTSKGPFLVRAYARFWQTTLLLSKGVPGFGLFAMNRAGRRRWHVWPDVISDDIFARLNFAPRERMAVSAHYGWPVVDGFAGLVRMRRRQEAGLAEIATRFPRLLSNRDPGRETRPLWQCALAQPLAFVAYCSVRGAARLPLRRRMSSLAKIEGAGRKN